MVKRYIGADNQGHLPTFHPPHRWHYMILNEAPLLVIQQILGHADPKTTLRYICCADELAAGACRYNTLPS